MDIYIYIYIFILYIDIECKLVNWYKFLIDVNIFGDSFLCTFAGKTKINWKMKVKMKMKDIFLL